MTPYTSGYLSALTPIQLCDPPEDAIARLEFYRGRRYRQEVRRRLKRSVAAVWRVNG